MTTVSAKHLALVCALCAASPVGVVAGAIESRPVHFATGASSATLEGSIKGDKTIDLFGATGSGKTEVYLRAAEATLAAGRSVLYLVPEIGLTPLLVSRISGRFPGQVAVLHSALSPRDRRRTWDAILDGARRFVVGARSAVFAPLRDPGLIVVDEEQDGSYKQEDVPRYHGRDLAVVRARQAGAVLVLGSATPSMESFHRARSGRYTLLRLGGRVEDRPLPTVEG